MARFGLFALSSAALATAFVSTEPWRRPTKMARVQATTLGSALPPAPAVSNKPFTSGIATTAAEAVAALATQGFAFDATPGIAEDDRCEPLTHRFCLWKSIMYSLFPDESRRT